MPSTTPRRYRADHSLGRVLAHQCRQGLYRLHASPSVPPLFAARQRSATGGVRTLGETCSECGGDVCIIPKALAPLAGQALACIEDPLVIRKILTCLDVNESSVSTALFAGLPGFAEPAGRHI